MLATIASYSSYLPPVASLRLAIARLLLLVFIKGFTNGYNRDVIVLGTILDWDFERRDVNQIELHSFFTENIIEIVLCTANYCLL